MRTFKILLAATLLAVSFSTLSAAFYVQHQTVGWLAPPYGATATHQAVLLAHPNRPAADHLLRHAAVTTAVAHAHALAIESVSARAAAGTASLLAATSGMAYEC